MKEMSTRPFIGIVLSSLALVIYFPAVYGLVKILRGSRMDLPLVTIVFLKAWVIVDIGAAFNVWFACSAMVRSKRLSETLANAGLLCLFVVASIVTLALSAPVLKAIQSLYS